MAGSQEESLEQVFLRALRRAATSGSGAASRPSQLRQQVSMLLGPERTEVLRPRLHRAVAAAEEHLPATLVSLAPLSEETLARQATELATRRGWTLPAATQTTHDWTTALGLVPEPSVPAPSVREPSLPEPSPPDPVVWPAVPHAVAWPPIGPAAAAALQRTGLPALAAARAYAGLALRLYWTLVAVLVVVAVAAAVLIPSAVPGHANVLVSGGSVLVALALSSRLRPGLLVATTQGLTFAGFDARMRTPRGAPVAVPWVDVRVEDLGSGGRLSTGAVRLGGLRVQVGPEGCALLRALEARS